MNLLHAGFSRVDATPSLGIFVEGYFKPRYAEGVLDNLEINALALSCGEERVILASMDNANIWKESADEFKEHICEVTGVPVEAIYLHGTHTHTGPYMRKDSEDPMVREYHQMVKRKMADAALLALADLKPARMGYGVGQAPGIAFVRRYRMKDGSVKTNPGVNNPEIVAPIGDVDERVSVLRFDRDGAASIVLANFGCHPDTVGGNLISADWPGFTRRTVEKAIPNTKCIFFNGAEGDVNHVNVHPKGGFLNEMFHDFDDVSRGYAHARYMGRVVAGGVLQAFDKVCYVDVDTLRYRQKMIALPSNMPKPEELPEAHRIHELHEAGRDAELPYSGMMLTTIVAEAGRMVNLEHGPVAFEVLLSGIAIGNVALIGIPGEPFNGVGLGLKAAKDWDLVIPCCLVNGAHGYFPMKDSYDEGGYEARSSSFKKGVAELIIEEGVKLMDELRISAL